MLPDERRSVGVITLIGILRMFGLFALLPVLSLYAATLEGRDAAADRPRGRRLRPYPGRSADSARRAFRSRGPRARHRRWPRDVRGRESARRLQRQHLGRDRGAFAAGRRRDIGDTHRPDFGRNPGRRAHPFHGRVRYRCRDRFRSRHQLRPGVLGAFRSAGPVPVRCWPGDRRGRTAVCYADRYSAAGRAATLGLPAGFQAPIAAGRPVHVPAACDSDRELRPRCRFSSSTCWNSRSPTIGRCMSERSYCRWPGPCH